MSMENTLAQHLITCKTLEGVLAHSEDFYNLTGDQLQLTIENKGSQVSV
jgi:hypothetical protein